MARRAQGDASIGSGAARAPRWSMVKIATICLHAEDWQRGATSWAAALGYAPHPEAPDVLLRPNGEHPRLGLAQPAEKSTSVVGATVP